MLLHMFKNLTVIHQCKKNYVVIKLQSMFNNSVDFHSNIYIPLHSNNYMYYYTHSCDSKTVISTIFYWLLNYTLVYLL